ncbi:MAG: ATP-binding cassette domain-containing protein, partial [Chloroflexota bacterium]|nr:ATP-binding cassette domain-containing protein [Chloroflexota bacterium]
AARDRVGVVFQDPESSLVMSRAGDEVAFGLENRCVPPSEIWPRVDEALEMVGFPYGRERPTDALSGGEQQRLSLAAALALRPGLLLLDEPTANLDPDGAALVRSAIARLLAGGERTMLLVEHRVAEAADLVDRVIVLEAGGGVTADGPPAEVFAGRGDELAAAGIWVPNHPLPKPPRERRSEPEVALIAEGVGYRFPGETSQAVGPVDLALRSSEALAIVGPNGSGKSTLALLLGGLLRPTTGSVTDPDLQPVWRLPARRLAQFIGSVFQDPEHQFLMGSVRDELTLAPLQDRVSADETSRKAAVLMERLHLTALAEANPFTLSGGEKRRLSVATALVGEPRVLILDEPTFGQDRRTAVELLDMLSRQRDEGSAVCFVTHDLPFAAALADRTLELAQ